MAAVFHLQILCRSLAGKWDSIRGIWPCFEGGPINC